MIRQPQTPRAEKQLVMNLSICQHVSRQVLYFHKGIEVSPVRFIKVVALLNDLTGVKWGPEHQVHTQHATCSSTLTLLTSSSSCSRTCIVWLLISISSISLKVQTPGCIWGCSSIGDNLRAKTPTCGGSLTVPTKTAADWKPCSATRLSA